MDILVCLLKLEKNVFDERNPLDKRKDHLVEIFDRGVKNFKPYFLSPTWSKLNNFSAHQKEDILRFSKLTLLLLLVSFLEE